MSVFDYAEEELIREEGHAIRLLQLHRGSGPEIYCSLFKAFLPEAENGTPYEALSYTWGGDKKTECIYVNKKVFKVTYNLYVALQHLRSKEDRILWIDAICINQSHSKERNQQVEHISSIYKNADRVLFWLGEATEDTDVLMDSLAKLQRQSTKTYCKSWSTTDPRWDELWSNADPTPASLDYLIGLRTMLSRDWFKRSWILQEVAYAKAAVVICGMRSVSARIFALVSFLLKQKIYPHCQAVIDIMPGSSRNTSWWSQSRDLYTLMVSFQYSEASDQRDKIFALLSMATDSNIPNFPRVDYEQTFEQLIANTANFLFPFHESPMIEITEYSNFVGRFTELTMRALKESMDRKDAPSTRRLLARPGILEEFLDIRSLEITKWREKWTSTLQLVVEEACCSAESLFHRPPIGAAFVDYYEESRLHRASLSLPKDTITGTSYKESDILYMPNSAHPIASSVHKVFSLLRAPEMSFDLQNSDHMMILQRLATTLKTVVVAWATSNQTVSHEERSPGELSKGNRYFDSKNWNSDQFAGCEIWEVAEMIFTFIRKNERDRERLPGWLRPFILEYPSRMERIEFDNSFMTWCEMIKHMEIPKKSMKGLHEILCTRLSPVVSQGYTQPLVINGYGSSRSPRMASMSTEFNKFGEWL